MVDVGTERRAETRAVLDLVTRAYFVLDPDPIGSPGPGQMRICYANPAMCRALGRQPAEFVGSPLSRWFAVADDKQLQLAITDVSRTGTPTTFEAPAGPVAEPEDEPGRVAIRIVRLGQRVGMVWLRGAPAAGLPTSSEVPPASGRARQRDQDGRAPSDHAAASS